MLRTGLQLRWKSQALPDILQYIILLHIYIHSDLALTQSTKKKQKKNIFKVQIFSFTQYSYMKYKRNCIILTILINLIKILLRLNQLHQILLRLKQSHKNIINAYSLT